MTLTKWIATPQLVAAWRDTWEQPHMRMGMELLMEKALPVNEVVPAGTDIIHFHAICNARREGFMMALRAIKTMGRGIPESLDPEGVPDGWGDVNLSNPPAAVKKSSEET